MPQVPPARYLLRAKDLVDARYAEAITVDDLAAAAGLSRAHFSRMFTRTFGESPRSYLQTRRLERAAALLRHTDRSVADICVMVGLQSVGSFTTSFARVYGLPPAAYRASMPPAAIHARVPSCILKRDTRPPADSRVARQHTGRRRAAATDRSVVPMIKVASAHLWVHDQEVALKYWTEKVGMEVRQDVSLPDLDDTFRWLTVGPRGQDDVSIVLMAVPGEPVMDEATRKQVLDLTAKGFAGTVFLTTEDCQGTYEELKARGVEFTEEPHQMPYGIDCGFRDPSGNSVRLTQLADVAEQAG